MRDIVYSKPSIAVRLMQFGSWISRVVSLPLVWLLHANPGERCFGLSGVLSFLGVLGILSPLTAGPLILILLILAVLRGVLRAETMRRTYASGRSNFEVRV